MHGEMKRKLLVPWFCATISFTAPAAVFGQGLVHGKVLLAQVIQLDGVAYKASIREGDLKATGGIETIKTGQRTKAFVPKLGGVDLVEATSLAKKYANELVHGEIETNPPLWRLESASIKWVSEEQGLGYYLIGFQPRNSENKVHHGALDSLSVVVLFSGEVIKFEKSE